MQFVVDALKQRLQLLQQGGQARRRIGCVTVEQQGHNTVRQQMGSTVAEVSDPSTSELGDALQSREWNGRGEQQTQCNASILWTRLLLVTECAALLASLQRGVVHGLC
jgi:hypothetical protein